MNCQELWTRLLAGLRERELIPWDAAALTPAEIAFHVREKTGDACVERFVWDYYYPAAYGRCDGRMSEAEAQRIVRSFEKQAAEPAASPPTAGAPCCLCRRVQVR
jgi:hypothetical protein